VLREKSGAVAVGDQQTLKADWREGPTFPAPLHGPRHYLDYPEAFQLWSDLSLNVARQVRARSIFNTDDPDVVRAGQSLWRVAGYVEPLAPPTPIGRLKYGQLEAVVLILGDQCPVQAEGQIDGVNFCFRARGQQWSLSVGRNPIEAPIWKHEEDYGETPFAAGRMSHETAFDLIEKALAVYCRDCP
jgi:hypothetical protein